MAVTRSAAAGKTGGGGKAPPPSSSSTTTTTLHPLINWFLVAVLLVPPILILLTLPEGSFGKVRKVHRFILVQLALGVMAYVSVVHMVEVGKGFCRRKGNTGKDLCKKGTPAGEVDIAESQGLPTGVIYLIVIIGCQLLYAQDASDLAIYNSSLLSICFMLFLGFIDDVLDLPWRYKLVLPPIATLPLLCSYKAEGGSTSVIIPKPFQSWLMAGGQLTPLGAALDLIPGLVVDTNSQGKIVDLGYYFLLYMALLAVFTTNAINIYAGINGLEAGQSFVIATGVLAFNALEVLLENPGGDHANQLFSMTLVLPFIAVTLGLLRHNFYPATVFVGDTFCYFAGMTFAVVGVHGHFSKTLAFLFIPQIINFLLSIPQLFKIVPCPRHRLPRFDPTVNKVQCSICPCGKDEYRLAKRLFFLKPDEDHFINLTFINVVLRVLGPTHERTLCLVLLAIQALSCVVALYVRFVVAPRYFT